MKRRGRPMGRTLLALAALVLVERRLRYGSRVPILPRPHEWCGLARDGHPALQHLHADRDRAACRHTASATVRLVVTLMRLG